MKTPTEIKVLCEELGIHPKRSLGQNFLIGDRVVSQIVAAVKNFNPSQIVEVGPGLGALTEELNHFGVPLLLIELDRKLSEYWRQKKFKLIEADALRVDWRALALPAATVLVSNLPYQIGGRLLIDRSLGPQEISAMVLMFQKEVAHKITSRPGDDDYGFLSVIAQTFWTIEFLLEAAPNEFFPSPQISSRVLVLRRKSVDLSNDYVNFVKSAFQFRRKRLLHNLKQVAQDLDWESLLEPMAISANVRAEELTSEQYVELFQSFQEKQR